MCSSFNAHAKVVLVLGDSISAAYGFAPEKGWVRLLAQRLETHAYQVVNASVSGNTTGDGLARLPALLTEHKPAIVIIELGGNDGLRGYPLKIMQRNLQALIDQSQATGAKVLMLGIEIPPNYGPRYTDLFRQSFARIANKQQVPLMPFVLAGVATNPQLMQEDGIHPTAEAQPILLENVWPYLEPLL